MFKVGKVLNKKSYCWRVERRHSVTPVTWFMTTFPLKINAKASVTTQTVVAKNAVTWKCFTSR